MIDFLYSVLISFPDYQCFTSLPGRHGFRWLLLVGILTVCLSVSAQQLVSMQPARNANSVSTTSGIGVTASQSFTAGQALVVHSRVAGGRKAGQTTLQGTTLQFAPTTAFKPGEVVTVTAPTQPRQVFQYTTAVKPGGGHFVSSNNVNMGIATQKLTSADIDGDGDLDILTINQDFEYNSDGNLSGFGSIRIQHNDGQGHFSSPTRIPVYFDYLDGITTADIDGDGDLDILVSYSWLPPLDPNRPWLYTITSGVYLFSNDGKGNFTRTRDGLEIVLLNNTVLTPKTMTNVVTADFNGDGAMDFLAGRGEGNVVHVALNDGNGLFYNNVYEVSVGLDQSSPNQVAAADVDGDGDMDILTMGRFSSNGRVSIRYNNGNGVFSSGTEVSAGLSRGNIAMADIDGDGDLDMLTPYNSDYVNIWLNDGTGHFPTTTSVSVNNNIGLVAAADVDGDGDIDIVTTSVTSSGSIRLNDGKGNFSATAGIGLCSDLALADVDGDGRLDILSLNGDEVNIRLNIVLEATQPAANAQTVSTTSTVAITTNQVGAGSPLKAFSAQAGGLKVGTQANAGSGTTFTPTTPFKPGERVLVSATYFPYVFEFTTAVKAGVGNFNGGSEVSVGTQPNGLTSADVDGDGDLDMLVANIGASSVSIRLNEGTGQFSGTTEVNVSNSPSSVITADIDGDHDLDLLTANYSANTVSLRLNDGQGHFSGTTELGLGSGASHLAAADIDGDGDLDLLITYFLFSLVGVQLNDGQGNFSTTTSITGVPGAFHVVMSDVDKDGDLDLVTTNYYGQTVSLRYNNGKGVFSGNTEINVGNAPTSLAIVDIDDDGDLDLLTANSGDNSVSIRFNDGQGNFSGTTNVQVGNSPFDIVAGDVDGDGDLDLLTANKGSNIASILLNNGSGSFTPAPANPSTGNAPVSLALGDIDGDGDLDLLTANQTSNTVSVRFNQAPAPTITSLLASPAVVCTNSPTTFTATIGTVTGSYTFTLTNGNSLTTGSSNNTAFSQSLTTTGSGLQTFTLIVSNSGLLATATTTLTVNALPTVSIAANPGLTITNSQSITLTATGASSYSWNTGATSSSIIPPLGGIYSVKGTNNGCSATISVTVKAADLTPTLVLPQANFAAIGTTNNFLVSLFEVNGLPTTLGSVAITITAPVGYTLSFSPSITSIQVSGATENPATVSNSHWTVTNTLENRQISLVIKPDQSIAAGASLNLGFSITRTTANAGSTANITVNVNNDATKGYDGNSANNVYARIISGL